MKLFNKVAAIAVGVMLATGVGAGIVFGSRDYAKAEAANPGNSIYQSGQPSWGTSYSYGSITLNGVDWYITTYGNNNSIGWNKASQDKSSDADFGPLTVSDSSYGMYQTSGDFTNAQKISVSVTNTDAQKGSYAVFYSTNSGSTWTSATTGSVTTTKGSSWSIAYDHGSKIGNSVRFAFGVYGNDNTAGTRLSITQIEVWEAATASYTVSFNSNGGTGSMSNVTDVSGSYTLPANGFTAPANKAFAGWKAENAGDLIAAGGTYNVSANVTFYAQWANAYTVTYTAGANGSGSYAHTSQPAGTYTLLQFANLTGVSASTGYRFKDYTVGGVAKNPGDTITLSAATAITVNFEEKPIETTYNFGTNFATYASEWTNTYGSKTLDGKDDVGGEYAATIYLAIADKQTSGVGSDKPYVAHNTNSDEHSILFTLTETGYKIKDVTVTFEQRGTNVLTFKMFKGTSYSGIVLDSATIGAKNTLSTTNLNDTSFSITGNAGGTSRKGAALVSIYISLEAQASFGTLDHISITSLPTTIYHVGETFDSTGFAVTAYDGADETTATFKDVTASVTTDLDGGSPYEFVDNDVPGFDCEVSYSGDGGSDTTSFHIYVYALGEYKLVTSAPSDWSGNYLIVSTNADSDLCAMDGSLHNIDVEKNYKVISANAQNVVETGEELEFSIATYSTGYSIRANNGKYLGWGSGSANGLTLSDTALLNSISLSDGLVTIAGSGGKSLKLDTAGDRFRYYTSGTVQLYKLVESENADAYAQTFLGAFTCNAAGTSQPTFALKEAPSTYWSWSLLATEYNTLTAAEKEQFRLGVASETGTNLEKALARYDYIVGKYNKGQGITSYTDFMNRNPAKIGASRTLNVFNEETGTAAAMVVVVVSAVSVTALGGFFLLKKKPF